MNLRFQLVALVVMVLATCPARADLSGRNVSGSASGKAEPSLGEGMLKVSAHRLPGKPRHRFVVRVTNQSNRPVKLLFRYQPVDGVPLSPFHFRFDENPSQTLPIYPAAGSAAIRTIGPKRSVQFVTNAVDIVGNEYEPRVVYDAMSYLGNRCAAPQTCYLTEEECPDCELGIVESEIIATWPPPGKDAIP